MLPSCFFCPIAALNFSPLSVTTIRLLPPSSFVRLALEQNKLQNFAVRTGLEPATPGVTGRYSNQLNYRTICSDLCVFLERGCKGTQKIGTSKFFAYFFAFFSDFLSFHLDHPVLVFWFRFLNFRDPNLENSINNLGVNVFSVCIVRKEESLCEF